jgi:hypothetical protein
MVRHIEDSVTVWFGMQVGNTLLKECTVFAFRFKCGGNVSVWDIGTCPPNYISRRLHKIVKNDCYLSHVHLSVHMDKLRSDNIRCSSIFGKYVKRTKVSLQSDKNDDYYTVLHSIAQYSIVLHSTAQYCTVLYSTAQYCTVLHSTAQYCTVLHSTAQYCTVLHSTAQYCTVLHSTAQYYTVLHTTAHEHQYNCMIISLPVLLRMRNISDQSCRENQNTHLMSCNILLKIALLIR